MGQFHFDAAITLHFIPQTDLPWLHLNKNQNLNALFTNYTGLTESM